MMARIYQPLLNISSIFNIGFNVDHFMEKHLLHFRVFHWEISHLPECKRIHSIQSVLEVNLPAKGKCHLIF